MLPGACGPVRDVRIAHGTVESAPLRRVAERARRPQGDANLTDSDRGAVIRRVWSCS
jgi:hypothetical protein